MEHWELAARESIRDLVARYNANGDAGRFDPMLELFCADAVMELPDRTCRGRAEIRAFFEQIAARTGRKAGARFVRHFTATHQIDVEGPDRASGRAYYLVLTDSGPDHWGRYVDRYQCEEGRWRFAHRKVTLDAAVPGGWGAGEG
jgi:ketosteroid isomerase-like protein